MPIDTCYNSMYWSHNASITLLFQQFNSAEKAVIKYVTVVRIISNPHHIVVRTISNPHHIVVRTISNPHHDVVRISTSLFNSPVAKLVLNAKLPSFLKIETFLNGQTVNYIQLVKQRVFFSLAWWNIQNTTEITEPSIEKLVGHILQAFQSECWAKSY